MLTGLQISVWRRKHENTTIYGHYSVLCKYQQLLSCLAHKRASGSNFGPCVVASRAPYHLESDIGFGNPARLQLHERIRQGIFGFRHPIGVHSTLIHLHSSSILSYKLVDVTAEMVGGLMKDIPDLVLGAPKSRTVGSSSQSSSSSSSPPFWAAALRPGVDGLTGLASS